MVYAGKKTDPDLTKYGWGAQRGTVVGGRELLLESARRLHTGHESGVEVARTWEIAIA